jgi:hypothetical protein
VMPGRSMVGRESLKLVMSVRFAPRQPDLSRIEVRGVVKATVTSLSKKNTVTDCSLLMFARSFNWIGSPALHPSKPKPCSDS